MVIVGDQVRSFSVFLYVWLDCLEASGWCKYSRSSFGYELQNSVVPHSMNNTTKPEFLSLLSCYMNIRKPSLKWTFKLSKLLNTCPLLRCFSALMAILLPHFNGHNPFLLFCFITFIFIHCDRDTVPLSAILLHGKCFECKFVEWSKYCILNCFVLLNEICIFP